MEGPSDTLGLVGTTIAEKYAIESVVGEGGFATVYRATHKLWNRPVAVKVFKALGEVAAVDRKRLLDDFIQEGRLLADLSERSPAICQARDVGMLTTKDGGSVPYMVLEWLEGQPLEDVLSNERARNAPRRPLEATIHLLGPIAEALALAHKQGIAHRDVKPANVFVLGAPNSDDAGVKLLDFGIAKVVQDAQKMGFGKTAGHITSFTPSYGAPEQFDRGYGATGPWTDVFALALVVVEVLTGKEALGGDSLVQLAFASADPTRRPTPRTYGVATIDEVEAVFQKALAVQPNERYATAGEFWSALRGAALGDPRMSRISQPGAFAATALAPPTSSPSAITQQPPLADKKKSNALPLIAGLIVLVAGASVVTLGALKQRSPRKLPPAAPPVSVASSVPAVVGNGCPDGMKSIPGGEFFMGSDDKRAEDFEKPPHKVMLMPYCLDELEVTIEHYKKCSDPGACLRAGRDNHWDGITQAQSDLYDPLCNENDPVAKAKHPVNCVTWEQAERYCALQGARLPTEAEWEFSARGTDGRTYPWGDAPPSAELLNACGSECVAWMKKHPDPTQPILQMYEQDDKYVHTAPVGSFPKGKSWYGIQDLVGNVAEWVADWYAPYDRASAQTMMTNPQGPATGKARVIRGGSWNAGMATWVRPSYRFRSDPSDRNYGTGFRCAKSLAR